MSVQINQCLRIIELLVTQSRGLPLREIATQVDMPKSGAHRLLLALIDNGYVVQERASQNYLLSTKLPLLGLQYSGQHIKHYLIQPTLDRIAAWSRELVQVTMATRDALYWVAASQGATTGLRFEPDTGTKALITCTAVGQVWLSTMSDAEAERIALINGFGPMDRIGPKAPRSLDDLLERVRLAREVGYAVVRDSGELGVCAVACPVFDPSKEFAVGTLGIVAPAARASDDRLAEYGRMLIREAPELSAAFSYVFVASENARAQSLQLAVPA